MILKLLLTTMVSFLPSHQIARAQGDSANMTLYECDLDKIPAGARPVYADGNNALFFGMANLDISSQATPILATAPGDYYIIRLQDSNANATLLDAIPHYLIGNSIVAKVEESKMVLLSGIGWGLSKLSSVMESSAKPYGNDLPMVTVVDSNIVRMIAVITPQSSRQIINDLTAINTRYSFSQGCRTAEEYMFDRLGDLGLSTSYFDFQYSGTDMRDVIGELAGSAFPESVIVVCGHLDCTSETPDFLAPGAEDNGSGSAVVLEAARALSPFQTDLTVRFIAFTGEEQGLIGSENYAAYIQQRGEIIAAVINVDMVGYSGPYALDMHIFSDSHSHILGALGAEVLATYTSLDTLPHYDTYPQYGSDHYPFAIRGYPAIFFIDAWDDFDWYPYYHTTADTSGNLDFTQQASIGQAVAALTAILARPYFGPQYLPGDANGSGDVNGIDVVYLVNYLKGGPAPQPLLRGDCNGDCATNGLDVVFLVNYLKGGPAPFSGNCRL